MKRRHLDTIVTRLAAVPSLASSDRMCLGYTAGGRAPDVDGRVGCELRWRGSAVPWWLAPLRIIAAANRTLFEVTDGRRLPTFVSATDCCFTVEIYSCPRRLLPVVVSHMREAGIAGSPGEVIDQDPAYFELKINCDGGPHESWWLRARCGSDCPEDLTVIARAVDEEDAPEQAECDRMWASFGGLNSGGTPDLPLQTSEPGEYPGSGFPSWQAPIVGAIVVGIFGLYTASELERPITIAWVAGSVLVGAVIGVLVALCDGRGPGTVVSRFLAVISPATALLPIAGLPFNVAAYIANRRHPGMYRTISRISMAVAVVVAGLIGILWLF